MSRRSWFVVLPLALVVVLAAGWSAFWVYVQGRVETELARAIAREAAQGRAVACGEQQVAGYPFRIEVTCARASFAETRQNPVLVEAERVLAVAQIYRPNHLIVEVTGPVRVREPGPGGRPIATAEWARGRASIVTEGGRPERVSIELDKPALAHAEAAGPVRAGRAELHLRRRPGSDEMDVALRAAALEGSAPVPGVAGPSDVEVQATVSGFDAAAAVPAPERLRRWQQAGGRLRLALLRVVSTAGSAVEAAGDLGLDGNGRANGTLRLAVHDLERVFRDLVQMRLVPREMMTAVPTLTAVGQPTEIAGRRAVALPINVREGLIRIGPVPIGAVPRLF